MNPEGFDFHLFRGNAAMPMTSGERKLKRSSFKLSFYRYNRNITKAQVSFQFSRFWRAFKADSQSWMYLTSPLALGHKVMHRNGVFERLWQRIDGG